MLHSEYVDRTELGNGRIRDTIALKPIAHRVNGSLRRMTNLLSASGDPAMPIGCDELVAFRFDPRIAGKSPLFHFGKGQSFVKVALLNANNVSGTVNGNEATFVNAWNGADLHLANGGHFVSFVAPLKAGHPRSFSFRVDSHAGFDPETLRFGNDFSLSQPALVKDTLTVPLQWVKSQQGGKWILTVNLPNDGKDYAGWVLDPTLTLQPDGTAGVDTHIYQFVPDTAYGTSVTLQTWSTFSAELLRFNVSAIPAAATITAATLSLWNVTSPALNTTHTFYSILAANTAWSEASTWNYAVPTSQAWAGSAGCATAGTDYNASALGSLTFANGAAANTQVDATLNTAQVQAWVAGNNYGLKGLSNYTTFFFVHSSDGSTAAYRPKLVVEYTLPGGGSFFGSSVMHSAIFGQQLAR